MTPDVWIVAAPLIAIGASLGAIVLAELLNVGLWKMSVISSGNVDKTIITLCVTIALATSILHLAYIHEIGMPLYLYIILISSGMTGLVFKIYLRE